jgi:hypothetical protein
MNLIIRVVLLIARTHAAFPAQPIERVAVAAIAAARAETPDAPAEVLLAIADHESDLQPRAVSWRGRGGQRVDILWDDRRGPPGGAGLACGLVQTVAHTRAACAELLDPITAMRAGAAELGEWLSASGGNLRVALAGYAGGWGGARDARTGARSDATAFADIFRARAYALGWRPTRRAS